MAAPQDRASLTANFVLQALGNEWHPESDDYTRKMIAEGYTTPAMLMTITEEDLKFCGVEKRAHLRSFLMFIQKLVAKEATVVDSASAGPKRAAPAAPLSTMPLSNSTLGFERRSPPRFEQKRPHFDIPQESRSGDKRSPPRRDDRRPLPSRDDHRPAEAVRLTSKPAGPFVSSAPRDDIKPPVLPNLPKPISIPGAGLPPTKGTPPPLPSSMAAAAAPVRVPPAAEDKPRPATSTTRTLPPTAPRLLEPKAPINSTARLETRISYPMPPIDEPIAARPVKRGPSTTETIKVEVANKVIDLLSNVVRP